MKVTSQSFWFHCRPYSGGGYSAHDYSKAAQIGSLGKTPVFERGRQLTQAKMVENRLPKSEMVEH